MNKSEAITLRVAQSAVRQKLRERTVSELKLRGFRFNLSENKGIVHLDHGTTLYLLPASGLARQVEVLA